MLWSLREKKNTQTAEAATQLGNKVNIYLFMEIHYDIYYDIIQWVEMCITGNQKGRIY